jgi:hypothetical protein
MKPPPITRSSLVYLGFLMVVGGLFFLLVRAKAENTRCEREEKDLAYMNHALQEQSNYWNDRWSSCEVTLMFFEDSFYAMRRRCGE